MESQDKRVSLISELRDKYSASEGDYIEWWGTVDGIAVKIVYSSENAENIIAILSTGTYTHDE